MREDTRDKLIEAVTRPFASSCALNRLRDLQCLRGEFRDWNPALGQPSLIDSGELIGLSVGECCGVMDGWDAAGLLGRGSGEVFADLNVVHRRERVAFSREEYERGRELGRELHALAR